MSFWQIKKKLNQTRKFNRTRYHIINSRLKAFEKDGYLRKAGETKSKAGSYITIYESTNKACFALILDSLELENLINELDETATLSIVSLILSR